MTGIAHHSAPQARPHHWRREAWKLPIHLMFILISITMIVPLIMIFSISISEEAQILGIGNGSGFSILPKGFSLDGYHLAFKNPDAVIKAYGVTAYSSFLGTAISMASAGMIAYPLARSNFKYKPIIQRYLLITMLFGAGTIPTYIVYTQYYHLGDSLLIYIMPCICGGAGTTFMLRAYMKGLSESLYESAELDGANKFQGFLHIGVPLGSSGIVSALVLSFLDAWNLIEQPLTFLKNKTLWPLSLYLPNISMDNAGLAFVASVITLIPSLLVFMAGQNYLEQGIAASAVKE